jgi:hypothetical protein
MAVTWDKAGFDKSYDLKGERWGRPAWRTPIRTHYNDFLIGQNQRDYKSAKILPYILGNTVVVGAGFGWTVEGLIALGVNAIGTDISSHILDSKDTDEEADLRGYIIDAGIDPDNDWCICDPAHVNAVWMENPHAKIAATGAFAPGHMEWMCRPIQLIRTRVGPRTVVTIADEDSTTNGSRNRIRNALGSVDMVITQEVLNSIPNADVLTLCQHMAGFNKPVVHILSPIQPDATQDPDLNWKTYQQWSSFISQFPNQKILGSVSVEGYPAYSRLI